MTNETKQDPSAKAERSIQVVNPEQENGNTEYKRKLHGCTPARLERLKTQMSYRLDEGKGVCTYCIGVEDDGCHSLLDYEACKSTAHLLELLGRSLNAVVRERRFFQGEIERDTEGGTPRRKQEVHNSHRHEEKSSEGRIPSFSDDDANLDKSPGVFTRAELVFQRIETHLLDPSPLSIAAIAAEHDKPPRKQPNSESGGALSQVSSVAETLSTRNLRVAVVGNVDAGKSTLIGTLTSTVLDDGRGSSRTSIMKHRHEIESGRTSTAATHLLGFTREGGAVAAAGDAVRGHRRKPEDEIAKESHRVVSLMDLAGHEKYLKTTIHGVASGMADYALVLVNSRHNPTHMTHHHLNLCASFGIQIIVVFTKIDGCPDHAFKSSKEEVYKLLKAPDVGKTPFEIRSSADVDTCILGGRMKTLAPVVTTSCVSGKGIGLLRDLLFRLPKRRKHEKKLLRSFEFLVDDVFRNVPGVGSVVSGFVNAGRLSVGSSAKVFVGPTGDGTFLESIAKSAHIARITTTEVVAGQSACLALALSKDARKKLRRGMVVLTEKPTATKAFEAEICVLKGTGTTIRRSYQAYVHVLSVRQAAFATGIELIQPHGATASIEPDTESEDHPEIVLRPGCRARVRFEFAQRPEYVRAGMRMLFRDGRVRGVGLITGIPDDAAT